MKPSRIILSLGILLLTALSIKAQDCKCPEAAMEDVSELTVIGVADYANFLNINGLKKYSNIKYEGLPFNSTEVRRYILKNDRRNTRIKATYGRDGNLINGIYIMKDSPIPKVIRDYLVTDSYRGWTMTSNKTIVHDFDMQKTEYEVKIQRGKMKQTLFFDLYGNRIKKLART
ncbi:hypothetical protein [Fodinibius sediminis]|uniref:Beta-lactamase-inhibitor-like, PepSY-like n=1 Tax=Fodinibius sediminis TaxID=1214077 RepID=A0A521E613_9BACT|nr:hypothetical protein [Fodinibius sediminis]SMO79335.1 hypothetical protein SAMN06265218_113120 [Fodinibius sediminis]